MQRTSKGDCKAPEIVQGEAIHDWRTIPVGSCLGGGLRCLSLAVSVVGGSLRGAVSWAHFSAA
jgi:hypothetical protein